MEEINNNKRAVIPNMSIKVLIFLVGFFVFTANLSGQTKGLIYKTAAGAGQAVLDPNTDGYTSADTTGFFTDDEVESEIPYTPLPSVGAGEPDGDLGPGPSCGFTDLVKSNDNNTIYTYLDGSDNLMFRFRLGGTANNSKGYSILIDTDQKFGATGPDADPDYTPGNPGFEIEIVLRTNFGVGLYDVDNNTLTTTEIGDAVTDRPYDNFAQKSIALSEICGDDDYFYDFYIPFADITAAFPSVTTATPLRMVGNTVINPKAAIGNNGVSDLGGIDDSTGITDGLWESLIDVFPPTSASAISLGLPPRAACPSITGPIAVGASSITGTSTEVEGATIEVFRAPDNASAFVSVGTTTVTAGVSPRSWTITGLTAAVGGEVFKATATVSAATATATGTSQKSASYSTCNISTVGATCSALSGTLNCAGERKIIVDGLPAGSIIRLYKEGTGFVGNFTQGTTTTTTYYYACNGNTSETNCNSGGGCGGSALDGVYYYTVTESGQCESSFSAAICIGTSTSTTPTITTSPIIESTTTITGSSGSGAGVVLYIDGVRSTFSGTASGTSWTISGISGLSEGQSLTVYGTDPGGCPTESGAVLVQDQSATPTITNEFCIDATATVTTVNGVSSEDPGSVITIYTGPNGSETSTTLTGLVQANGSWSVDVSSANIGITTQISATAKTGTELESNFSSKVTVNSKTPDPTNQLTLDGPITEGDASISGTTLVSATDAFVIQLYIDGIAIEGATYNVAAGTATTTWVINGLDTPFAKLFAEGVAYVTITNQSSGYCESDPSNTVTINCLQPLNQTFSATSSTIVCEGENISFLINSTESNIVYQLVDQLGNGLGSAALGDGSTLALTASNLSPLVDTISVKAQKIGITCETTFSPVIDVTVSPTPIVSLASSALQVCRGDTSINLNYSIDANGPAIDYSIDFDPAAETTGLVDVVKENSVTNPVIISIPSNIPAGVYNGVFTIRNSNSLQCTSEPVSFTITVAEVLIGSVTSTNPTSCNATDGTITLLGLETSTSYSSLDYKDDGVTINHGAFISDGSGEYTIASLNIGNYTDFVVVLNGCDSNVISGPVALSNTNSPTISLGASPTVSSGTTSADLPYTATTNGADQYVIDYNGLAEAAGFVDISTAVSLPASPVSLVVPGSAPVDTYFGTISVINSSTGCVSIPYNFTVTIESVTITDTDGDGILDGSDSDPNDPCIPVQSAGYAGYDAGNAIWAAADCDSDGVTNGTEDTNGTDPYNADTDGDGVNDNTDSDATNPCIPVQSAGYAGYDAGNAIWAAADCDSDGVINGTEDTNGTDPYNADTDGDGVNDNTDSNPTNPCIPVQSAGYAGYDAGNAIWAAADCDSDGVINGTEDTNGTDPYNADTDGDGVNDNTDSNPTNPCIPVQSAGYAGYDAGNAIWAAADCDSDGVINGTEDTNGTDPYNADTDGDGVNDNTDSNPTNPCIPVQAAGYAGYDAGNAIWAAADCDSDGVTNGTEDTNGTDPYNADTDGDGVNDNTDSNPTNPCIPVQSAGYAGYDAGNAIWAAADCDSDGVTNGTEDTNGTDPYNADTDGDGVNDNTDSDATNPCIPVQSAGYAGYDATNAIWAAADCDSDGVTNGTEDTNGTDPYNADTDGDGVNDNTDSNPTNPCIPVQSAGYAGYDATNAIWAAADCDSDGVTNGTEDTNGTDPYNADTDGDGVNDNTDSNPTNPCIPVQSAGYAGYDAGNAIWAAADCDSDGVTNGTEDTNGTDPYNADTDGDGVNDNTDSNPTNPCIPVQSAGYAGYDAGNAIWAAADCDSDGVTNGTEDTNGTDPYNADTDGDGVNDNTDSDATNPCIPVQSAGYAGYDAGNAIWAAADCDSDGVTNGTEDTNGTDPYNADTDGDGVNDNTDSNPTNPCIPVQSAGYAGYDAGNAIWAAADCDSDGVTNGTEDTNGTDPYNADTDGDGVNDNTDSNPTNPCIPVQSAGYAGYDAGNAIWAAADCDSDGVTNGTEDTNGTDPYNADTDGDGVNDNTDSNPTNPCIPVQAAGYAGYDATNAIWAAADCDSDGVTNGTEDTNGTDPYNADTDGDGVNDNTDSDALDPCIPVQAAGYAGYDAGNAIWAAADCDSDGVTNGTEDTNGTDPYNADTDGDGVNDNTDSNPTNPCIPVQAAGYAGYDATNAIWAAADCDSDGVTNGTEDTNGTDPYNADTDGDGVNDNTDSDALDPCIPVQAAGYAGYDAGNAIWAAADCDSDGVTNGTEDTNGTDPYNADTDGDGVNDNTDSDALDPCIPVQAAGYAGYDAGNAIWAAADCDSDGVTNGTEDTNGTDPYNADTDGDGVNDNTDSDALDPCIPVQAAGYAGYDATNAIWAAADCDSDGVTNGTEDTNGTDPYNADTDGDGVNDNTDSDALDPCIPVQAAGYAGYDAGNAIWAAADCDSDGVTNGTEDTNGTDPYNADTDGDGVNDNTDSDALDPCIPVQSAGYAGYDAGNAIWAAADCDSDGVTNGTEDTNGTDPYNADTDGDGVNDNTDSDPTNPCIPVQAAGYAGYDAGNAIWAAADCDSDGVTNGTEDTNGTDPYNADTDGDGVNDNTDSNPTNPCIPVQAAGYAGYDATNAIWAAADCDSDGVTNGTEDTNGTDPYNADTDGDGVNDNTDSDATNPCIPVQAAGYAGYDAGNAIWAAADCDSDGVTNGTEDTNGTDPYNADTDGDGVNDNTDSDATNPCIPVQAAGYAGYDAGNAIWAAADCDSDGVTNGTEDTNGTDPYNADTDGDGVNDNTDSDALDPCIPVQAAGYAGYDAGNAIWAAADCDSDGVTNGTEDTNGTDPYNADTDGDGVNDNTDSDATNPCIPVQAAGYAGYDATNAIWAAADCDSDGVTNGTEDTNGTDPYNADTDGDGVNDNTDSDALDPCIPVQAAGYAGYDAGNAIWAAADCDSDGVTNGTEDTNGTDPYNADTDGDGVNDNTDSNPTNPCIPVQAAGYAGYDATNAIWAAADCDSDGVTNGTEDTNGTDPYNADTDGDGVNDNTDSDALDPCIPVQAAGYAGYDAGNAIWAAADCDSDGVTNGTEDTNGTDPYNADTDGDGVNDNTDSNPTNPCIPVQAAGYAGYDATNAIWAAADCDSDGVTNGTEDTNGTDPYNADTDGDGVNDNTDSDALDPCIPVQAAGYAGYDAGNAIWAAADCDSDGVTNGTEDTNGTDPYNADTDGDGVNDNTDSNPTNPCIPVQSAGYAGYDAGNAIWAAADCDSDGVTNGTEDTNGTDPYNADTDGDGVNDNTDSNPTNPCIPVQSAGYAGYDAGNAIWAAADCDSDGVTNGTEDTNGTDPYNADTDGDGVNDNTDSDATNPCIPVQSAGYAGYDAGNAIWAAADCDSDGVINGTEDTNGTDPYNADTDGDGNPDGTDPNLLIPTADGDTLIVTEGTSSTINILTNDDYFDNSNINNLGTTTISQTGGTAGGTINFDPTIGSFEYTPLDSEAGTTVTVIYQVCNDASGSSVCASATISITVLVDTDNDGVPDIVDIDDDNDGIPDTYESGGNNPNTDLDNDGVPAYLDEDDADNTIGDDTLGIERLYDFDGDGIPNHLDLDSDNDAISDVIEAGYLDTNNDGFHDSVNYGTNGLVNEVETAVDSGILNSNPLNTDAATDVNPGFTLYNFIDFDSDNDGITDTTEAFSNNSTYKDDNNDGIVDGFDDLDGNGVYDTIDAVGFSTPLNSDADSLPNYRDLDSDGDGLPDTFEGNFQVADGDNNGIVGTGIPADSDGDGLPDTNDPDEVGNILGGFGFNKDRDDDGVKNYLDIDIDNDGIIDNIEGQSTFAHRPPTGFDTDGDGIDDAYDVNNGGVGIGYTNTDGGSAPDYADTNSDGIDGIGDAFDILENATHNNPDDNALLDLVNNGDGSIVPDGMVDPLLFVDVDGDGLHDDFDNLITGTSDPLNATNNNQLATDHPDVDPVGGDRDWRELSTQDKDQDGIVDVTDKDDDNDGILDVNEDENLDGDNDPRTNPTDSDGDGEPDYFDLDSDNDGITDYTEAGGTNDPDGNGMVGSGVLDNTEVRAATVIGSEGIPMAVAVTGLIPFDTDGDGILDFQDIDSDNDGISDVIEAGGIDPDGNGQYGGGITNDADADGLIDAIDPYDDRDGNLDTDLGGIPLVVMDTDGDGHLNHLDLDSDNDTIPDNVEGQSTVDYIAPSGLDTDDDGLDDSYDIHNSGIPIMVVNTDAIDTPDYLDLDADNDGTFDIVEAGNGIADTDFDGITNGISGSNGLDNNYDDTVVGDTFSDVNGALDDTQFDNFPDADGDVLIGGDVDYRDNTFTDTDGDGLGDGNDPDLNDPCDPVQAAGYTGYDATNAIWQAADCDGDGVTNGNEFTNGTDPYATTDTDGDGLSDELEDAGADGDPATTGDNTDKNDPCDPVQAAGYTGYDATNAIWQAADCDGDGVTNGNEFTNGTDPYATTDTDGDGLSDELEDAGADGDPATTVDNTDKNDPCDPVQAAGYTGYDATNAIWQAADCDGDGVTNGNEFTNGTDPYATTDTDGDGLSDELEDAGADGDPATTGDNTDKNDPCDPVQAAGYTGYDATNAIWQAADCDGDGVTNGNEFTNGTDPYATTDTDGDGLSDELEDAGADGDPATTGDNTDKNDPCDPVQAAGYAGYDATNAIWQAADCDGDGVTNGNEFTNGTDPYATTDTDGDGLSDELEDAGADGDPATTGDNTDKNDPCDPVQAAGYTGYDATNAIWQAADCDGDGVTNGNEFTNGTDPYATTDTDGDGLSDELEDAGADGDPATTGDNTDKNDPCDPVQAAGYTGYDATNAIWQAADCDGDGVTNGNEFTNGTDPYATTDTDGDGLSDELEDAGADGDPATTGDNTDKNDPCDPVQAAGYTGYDATNAIWQAADCDGDGVTNGNEFTNGTDPYATTDTDGDGLSDELEDAGADGDPATTGDNTDKNDPCDPVQAAGYTGYDATNAIWQAADCDGDGVTNGNEFTNGTDPYATTDTDGDGLSDELEDAGADGDPATTGDNTDKNDPCDPVQAAGYTGYDATNAIWQAADCDGDGVTNGNEFTNGTDPYATTDTDGDGLSDELEDAGADGDPATTGDNTDKNDPCDPVQAAGYTGYDATNAIWQAADCDGDGVTNGNEFTNGTDPYATTDTDGDGLSDELEDAGADGDPATTGDNTDKNDPCDPVQAAGYTGYDATNAIWQAADCDGDGVTNGNEFTNGTDPYATTDTDGDGLSDELEDAGADGDPATTGDNTDKNDPCDPVQAAGYAGYDATNAIWQAADCDGDGVTNGNEFTNGTDPYATTDTDGDGLSDELEDAGADGDPATTGDNTDKNDPCDPVQAAGYTGYDATNAIWQAADCDGDGVTNGNEFTNGTDPYATTDTDGDGLSDELEDAGADGDPATTGDNTDKNDPCDPVQAAGYTGYDATNAIWQAADCDGDGVTNGNEFTNGTDPYATTDTDGDGLSDELEDAGADGDPATTGDNTDKNDPCDPVQAAGYTGYDATNAIWQAADCDGDGVTNGNEFTNGTDPYATTDTDGDGLSDELEDAGADGDPATTGDNTDKNDPCDPVQAAGYTGYDATNAIWQAADCDGDGVTNGNEFTNGTDPYATTDTDGDGLSDELEDAGADGDPATTGDNTDKNDPCDPVQAAGYTGYDATNAIWQAADCDGDGVTNGNEFTNGTDPYATTDTDGDGLSDELEDAGADGDPATTGDNTDKNDPCDPVQAAGYTGYDATNAIWQAADCDGDGVTNGNEFTNGTDPYATTDTDGDGLSDELEDAGADGDPATTGDNTDKNDPCDPVQAAGYTGYDATNAIWQAADCDGDGVTNGNEFTNGTDPYATTDTDGDGLSDELEDAGADGDPATTGDNTDKNDPCDPVQAAGYTGYDATNAIWQAADCDGDGVTNGNEFTNGTDPYATTDTDGDGLSDELEDAGADGDPATTGDNTDKNDPCDPVQAAGYTGYDATNAIWQAADCDGDGVTNGNEFTNGTDPYATTDTDGDGLSDELEDAGADGDPATTGDNTDKNDPCDPVQAAGYTGYDATNAIWQAADCDGDGVTNGNEFTNGTDPYATTDTDGDGLSDELEDAGADGDPATTGDNTDKNDPCDPVQAAGYTGYDATNAIWQAADCDGDGVTNGNEFTNGTDPYATTDTDGDGLSDELEDAGADGDPATTGDNTDKNDPCDPVQAAGYTGYDATNAIWQAADCDGDGVTNGNEFTNGTDPYATTDTDGDGLSDELEDAGADGDPATTGDNTDKNDPCDPVQAAGYTGYDATNAIWQAADCDGDGVTNGDEFTNGTDPYATTDTDGDGLSDELEDAGADGDPATTGDNTDKNDPCDPVQAAGYTGYDATNAIWQAADCDGDGVTNGNEFTNGTDPYSNVDTDGDGINDDLEIANGTDETDPCDPITTGCQATLEVTKIAQVFGTSIGDKIDYTIEVENTGDVVLNGITLIDTFLDANGNTISLTQGPDFDSADLGSFEGSLLAGEIATYTASFTITQAAINSGGVSNSVLTTAVTKDFVAISDISDDGDDFDGDVSSDPTITELGCLMVINEFSPNQDGVGDTLVINCIDNYPNNKLEIYNRWGNIVYEKRGYRNEDGWDGTSNGRITISSDEKLPEGTYYYVIDLGNGSKPKVGWIYINR